MRKFRMSFWTGPVAVHETAQKMREAGVDVYIEGTERVWVHAAGENASDAEQHVRDLLNAKYGDRYSRLYSASTPVEESTGDHLGAVAE